MSNEKYAAAIFITAQAMLGCGAVDPYAEKYASIKIGEKREEIIRKMGQPTSQSAVEIPLVEIEMLAWRAPLAGATYTVHIVQQRAISKSAIK